MAIDLLNFDVDNDGDLIIDSRGRVAVSDNTGSTKQVILFRLKTAADDFKPSPNLGADIEGSIGIKNNRGSRDALRVKIESSLTFDGFLSDDDFSVKIIPVSPTKLVCVILVNSRGVIVVDEFSVSFTYDYQTGNIQMLDEY
jgi:hypothetical protein